MARVNEDRLLDCILNEVFAALGCATLAAVPGALIALSLGLRSWVGVTVGGLLAYAVLTGTDVFARASLAARQEGTIAGLRAELATALRGQPAGLVEAPAGHRGDAHVTAPMPTSDAGSAAAPLPPAGEAPVEGAVGGDAPAPTRHSVGLVRPA